MQVGLLNERISLLSNATTVEEIGNYKQDWIEFYSCYAAISNETPQEVVQHGLIIDDSKITFTIRYSSDVKDLTSLYYRVRFKGRMYNIVGIEHMNYRKKSLKIHCQLVER